MVNDPELPANRSAEGQPGGPIRRANDITIPVILDRLGLFYVWNLSATYEVNKQIQVYTRVDNIFNEKYEEVLFFGTAVRSVFGGVRINYDMPL